MSQTVDAAINERRLGSLIDELAGFGARPDGGVNRQALTQHDFRARRFLVDLARVYDATVTRDRIGNLSFRRVGSDDSLAPVVTGSHVDTQPNGGRLDGAYGVCAGLEVLAALRDSGSNTRRPVEVVVWTNEEGCRFAPGSMGANTFVNPDLLDQHLNAADKDGRTVRDQLDAAEPVFADVPLRSLKVPFHAFVEAHIEQGPVLAEEGLPIGVVGGIQGTRWFDVEARGVAAHAGTVPRAQRQDAMRDAADAAHSIYQLYDELDAGDGRLRLTIGRVDLSPNSVNVIPERVRMTVDVRHPDDLVLDKVEAGLHALKSRTVSVKRSMAMTPVRFPGHIVDAVRAAAAAVGAKHTEIDSGAFHDSLYLARHCDTGMIFVPSIGGISHNPAERTALADLTTGVRVLAETITTLAT